MRGLPYLQVPTSLLAMLDASVGGKTGVDTPQGKNLIGAFHPPAAVLADPRVLATLPERDYRGGMAEAVKHGLIADADYFAWMERERRRAAPARRGGADAAGAPERRDQGGGGERRRARGGPPGHPQRRPHRGPRAGAAPPPTRMPHGEAVALGLVAECALAEALGVAPAGLGSAGGGAARAAGPAGAGWRRRSTRSGWCGRWEATRRTGGRRVRFALPTSAGRDGPRTSGWTREAPEAAIREALGAIRKSP